MFFSKIFVNFLLIKGSNILLIKKVCFYFFPNLITSSFLQSLSCH